MAHAVAEHAEQHHDESHMGLPLPNGKLAMWLFLITEIMFFTALIGVYIILRNGPPSASEPWPTPHDVHLLEWVGALNTFVLICSSVTVVLAHWSLHRNEVGRAVQFIGITLALGCVFLVVKAFEYQSKFAHEILPGRIFEKLDGPTGARFVRHVTAQLQHIVEMPVHGAKKEEQEALEKEWHHFLNDARIAVDQANEKRAHAKDTKEIDEQLEKALHGKVEELAKKQPQFKAVLDWDAEHLGEVVMCWALLQDVPNLGAKQINERILGTHAIKHKHPGEELMATKDSIHADLPDASRPKDATPVVGILEKYPEAHLSYSIPWGNMWASCYFAMTGFHAVHVFGGLVIFAIMLIMAARGIFSARHATMVELTGLYWHFVDIVWIFLFPLLYLV